MHRFLCKKFVHAGDSISNEIIKIAVDVCAPHFVRLFNLILSGGVFPKKWAEGYRFNTFLERYNILNERQIGFRRGFRTSDHILVLKTLIDSYKNKTGRYLLDL